MVADQNDREEASPEDLVAAVEEEIFVHHVVVEIGDQTVQEIKVEARKEGQDQTGQEDIEDVNSIVF